MFKKHKIKKKIFFSVIVLTLGFFVLSIPSFANDESVGKTIEEKINSDINCNSACLRLSEAIEIKAGVANEKENAYNQAINHIKWWLSGLGFLAIAILTVLGVWRNNTLESARKKMEKRTEEEIKKLDEKTDKILNDLKSDFDAEKSKEIEELRSVIYKTTKSQEDITRKQISRLEDQLFQILLNSGGKVDRLDDRENIESTDENVKSIRDDNDNDPFA